MAKPLPTVNDVDAGLVAIVGMGCRWPGGVNSPRHMWSFLKEGGSGFRPFNSVSSPRCFSAAGFHHPDSGRPGTTAAEGAFLIGSDPRLFDHAFFGITGREVETLDPAQRKLLEVVYEAVENAGETWSSVAGSNTGVFVGNFTLDHWIIQARDWEYARPYSTTGASPSVLANRISHVFDLRGPSVAVDTACSSSMYAMHLAVNAIRSGDCDSAIVAASNWIADPSLQIALDKLGALSPTSRCHTFDASVDGYARGEGFAALYLKRLPTALASESLIRAIIRSTAVNANGRTGGITRPCAAGQEAVIRQAYANAGLSFSDTTYFECHGTGTPAGDPIELAAVGEVFASDRSLGTDKPGPLFVGSVKTNMGHAGGASALAAIMKVVLSLEAGKIPPSIDINVLNPNINFAKAGVEVVRQIMPWPKYRLRRASINSFGFGGANGHAIIESCDTRLHPNSELNGHILNGWNSHGHEGEVSSNSHMPLGDRCDRNGDGTWNRESEPHHPIVETPILTKSRNKATRKLVLLPFSAHTELSVQLNIEALSQEISEHSLADVAYTLSARRSDLTYRAYRIVDRDNPEPGLLGTDNKLDARVNTNHKTYRQVADVAFVFTGQGAQWHGMCTQLLEYRVFRAAIEHLDGVLRSLPTPPSTWSIADILKRNCDPDLIQTPVVSQTVCTAAQIGLVDLLASWSVRPAAVAGHSSGEIAAAYASGRSTAADAIITAYLRGLTVTNGRRDGAMLAVALGSNQLLDSGYLKSEVPDNGHVEIAAINSPGSVTVSGDASAIEALAARLAVDGVFHRLLRTGGMAYHSHHMVGLGQEYEESLSRGFLHIRKSGLVDEGQTYPRVPWVSSVTPDKEPTVTMVDSATYWKTNLNSPVRFSEAISNLVRLERKCEAGVGPIKALIEIGPHSALKGPLEQILKSMGQTEIVYAGSPLKRGEDALKSILHLAGDLYCMNTKVNLVAVNATDSDDTDLALVHGSTAVDLPPYQYTYGPINYYECRSSKEYRLRKSRPQWRNVLRVKDLPWLGDHRLLPDVVFPAAGYIAMAIEAALRTYEEPGELHLKPTGYTLRNISIKTALRLPEDGHGVEVILSMELEDAAPTALSSWASFSISSVGRSDVDSIDGTWIEHCTGIVKIEFGVSYEDIEKIEMASMDARVADSRELYKTFTTIGLGYGQTFQTVSDTRSDPDLGLSSARVSLNTAASTVPGGESRYALHPVALDGTFQLGLIACYGGRIETATTAFVPVHFSQVYIKDGIHNATPDSAGAIALGERRGLRGAYINQLQLLGPDNQVVLNIEKLRCISYIGEAQSSGQTSVSAFHAPFARMVWKPDFRTLSFQSCRALFPPPKENVSCLSSIGRLNRLASVILVEVYETFANNNKEMGPIVNPSGDIVHFFSWIKRCVEEAKTPELASAKQLNAQERYRVIAQLYLETERIVEAQIAKRLHENMTDILSGRQTGVDIMVHGGNGTNLLSALYQHGLFMKSAYPQLSRVLDGLSHANPHQRILELGAGTGGATSVAMKALTGPNSIKRYREYVFTDVSPGFLAAGQSSMANFRDISYSVLDIETDPEIQGFQPVYDVVLASQVLHATANISKTLKNCRRLLKPRGKLVFVENTTDDSIIVGLILGTLTGYWHGVPDGRINSPFMSQEMWDTALKEAGFSGIELALDDYPEPDNVTATLVSTRVDSDATQRNGETSKTSEVTEVHLLYSAERDPLLLGNLHRELEQRGIRLLDGLLDQAQSQVLPGAHTVVILDSEKDFLLDTEACYLSTFQHLARTASTLICLTFCGFSKGQNPEGALIPGLMRTIQTENPAGRFISIDVGDEIPDPSAYNYESLVGCVADQLLSARCKLYNDQEESQTTHATDHEYVWQGGCLWVSRAVPDGALQSPTKTSPNSDPKLRAEQLSLQPLGAQGPFRAAFATPGILSSLYFQPYTELLAPIPSDHIEVKVVAVGVNWKDLAVSSGRFDANNLSSEYAGIVTAVGADASGIFCQGDRVYGVGHGHFGNYTRVPAAFAQKLGAQDDLVGVSTIPLVYMTAVYAFDHLARLRRGHRVLIQSASGGLGLAAIQLARGKGAEVFGMVGTDEKAQFLIEEMKIPVSHVITVPSGISASTLDKKLTGMTPGGRGFDIILGTARGEVLQASIQALAPLGYYIDVGRTDVQDSKALGMQAFGKGVNFSSFDLSLVLEADAMLGSELMQTVHDYYRSGLIGPVHLFSASDISKLDQVLLRFSKGTHIGKLVVTFQDPESLVRMLPAPSQQQVRFDPTACYIVVGGLGGLGRSILRWMCERGARNIVVLSRRTIGTSPSAAQNLLRTLTNHGINIQPRVCDISDKSEVASLIQNVSSASANMPIKGVIHAAVSYLDLSFDKLTASRWRDSLAAKVQGTKNLHETTLSLRMPLDFFVMITSLESIYALATQSAYTAANAFQDAFARYRRRLGLPATSISFGFIKGVGGVGQDSITVDMFARNKALTLSESEFLARLEAAFLDSQDSDKTKGSGDGWAGRVEDPLSASHILTCLDPGAMAAREHDEEVKTGDLGPACPSLSTTPRWYGDARASLIMRAFEDARRDQRTLEERSKTVDFITGAISTAVASLLFVDISNVNPARTVADHGVDSLIAAELRNWFHQALRANIDMQALLDAKTSIAVLAAGIVDAVLAAGIVDAALARGQYVQESEKSDTEPR
ncbi:hypothetical protein F4802DRAFT_612982 [Xylaria palmicola]|nr:hypothetical protein F4802DRAFT_612982 [Xylaria palmicola]